MILLCLCSNQLWQNDGSYHQPAAFKHLKYTLSDLQPIRIQSDTYSWSILVLSTNQLYMQMPKVVLGLSDPPEWWGRYRASLSPCLIAGSQNYFRQCDKLLLMNEIHYHFNIKNIPKCCTGCHLRERGYLDTWK